MSAPRPFALAAHDLRRRGLAVIPCPMGKSPKGAYGFQRWKHPPGEGFVDDMIRCHGGDNIGVITSLSKPKLTVVDVDDPGECLQYEILQRFGESPLMTLTPSGGLHLWYRFHGEASANLRQSEGIPVEVKTAASKLVVIVPPSFARSSGRPYAFGRGTWDDLDRLPAIKPGALRGPDQTATTQSPGRIPEGARADMLWRYCMRQAPHCDDLYALIDVAHTFARDALDLRGRTHRLTDNEIENAAKSAWKYETQGRNLFGRGGATILPHDSIDRLKADPYAFTLYATLARYHNRGAEFALANAMARDVFGWTLSRFRAAVARLVEHHVIHCVHRGGRGPGDAPRYHWS